MEGALNRPWARAEALANFEGLLTWEQIWGCARPIQSGKGRP